jgi:hypothetical protein
MRMKTLQVLATVTVPVAALAIVLPPPQTAPATRQGSGKLLPGLAAKIGDGATLLVTGPDANVTLRHTGKRADAGWVLADKSNYPVPDAKIKPVIDALENLRGLEPKTERTALYARLDLAKPGAGSNAHGLTLNDAHGREIAAVILGRRKEDASGNGHDREYVRLPSRARSWLAEPAITLPAGTLDWIDLSVIDLDPDKIKQITIAKADGGTVTLARAKAGDKLALQNLPPGAKPKSDTPGADIPSDLQGLELMDVTPAVKVTGTPVAKVHAVTFDGLSADLTLVRQNGQIWATVAASGTKSAPITGRTQGWAYQIADAKAVPLQTALTDLATLPPPPKPVPPAPIPASAPSATSAPKPAAPPAPVPQPVKAAPVPAAPVPAPPAPAAAAPTPPKPAAPKAPAPASPPAPPAPPASPGKN